MFIINILLIGINENLSDIIKFFLKNRGYNVMVENELESYNEVIKNFFYGILIINFEKKDFDYISLSKEIKKRNNNIKIIGILNEENINEINNLFECGIDDFLKNPIELNEILMRILKYKKNTENMISYKNINLFIEKYQIKENKKNINFSKTEFELLLYLIKNKGKLLTRDEIYDAVWGKEDKSYRIIDVYIAKLRKKSEVIKDAIKAVKGVGYRIEN